MADYLSHIGASLPGDAFRRNDEGDDAEFYARDRFVQHLDARALETVERLIGSLVIETAPRVLDLMAGWDSHIPAGVGPSHVVGLGLNERELQRNAQLDAWVVHDVNRDPRLPFDDGAFDVVLNTVSVDYLTRPFDLFDEVGRVLKPGGLFLVIFSNRFFPEKVVRFWQTAGENERVMLVEDMFRASGRFEPPAVFVSRGLPRPAEDRYAHLGIPSDPVYAVYAERRGSAPGRAPRPLPQLQPAARLDPAELTRRKRAVGQTLCCPHCGERMKKWEVPQTPWTEWDAEYMYICFNDLCPYLLAGWESLGAQGNVGYSHRQMYEPNRRVFYPALVSSVYDLRSGIVSD